MTAPTATAATYGLATADAARSTQLTIRAAVMLDVLRLWPLLRADQLAETFPAWLTAMQTVVTSYYEQSSQAAATFYQAARSEALQSPTPASLIKFAPPPAKDWMAQAFGFSGPGLFAKETAAPGTALSTTLGTASRIALNGGRATLLNTTSADPAATGWYRVTDGHPCAFCAMLAARGITYRSQRASSFRAHDACGCAGAPAFSREQELPPISRVAEDIYARSTAGVDGDQKLVAFRKAWADHQAGRTSDLPPRSIPGARSLQQVRAELTSLEKALPAANEQQAAWLSQRISKLRSDLGQ